MNEVFIDKYIHRLVCLFYNQHISTKTYGKLRMFSYTLITTALSVFKNLIMCDKAAPNFLVFSPHLRIYVVLSETS